MWIEVRLKQPLNSSVLFRLGTMEAVAISNRAQFQHSTNVKVIIYPETLS